MEMEYISRFFSQAQKDPRISVTHIGLFAALIRVFITGGMQNPFRAFSYQVMPIAKISSTATYHKCIRDLSDFGYINYLPSYKSKIGSSIGLIAN